MKKEDASKLLERYLTARKEGKEPYFDADEIDFLLDSFEEDEDFTHYEGVLKLGLRLHPMSNDLKVRKSKFLLYNEEYQKALNVVESIAESNNQDLDMIRLECYCTLNQYSKAIEFSDGLINDKCDYLEEIFEFVAPILSDLDMKAEALDFIDRGLLLFPNNPILKDELCYIHELNGNFDEAIRICNELIDKDPYSYEYWFTLGRLYSLTNDFDKAIESFDFALTCDDSDMELMTLKAYCLFMNENYKKAIEVYTEIASDEESAERIKPLMAECYIKLENFEEAYLLLKDIIQKKGDSLEASTYINFIRCCVETDREREASQTLIKAADLFPDNVRVLSLLALTYLENGKEDLALSVTDKIFKQLDQINDKQTDDCLKLLQKGQSLFMKGEIQKALKYYKKILQINPQMPFMHFHIAMAYFTLGDMELFNKHFSKISKKELAEYLKTNKGVFNSKFLNKEEKHIAPEDLTKEYLKNKDNNN